MWRILIKHHIKASFRSPLLHGSTFAKVMSGIIIFFLSLQLIGLGAIAPSLLEEKFPLLTLQEAAYGYILFFVLFDLAIRTLMQKLPSFNLTPYLLQPIDRRKLARFMLVRSWMSYPNMYQHIFFVPFMLSFAYHSNTWQLFWWHYLVVIFILIVNHHLTLIMQYKLPPLLSSILPIIIAATLISFQFTGIVDLFSYSQDMFMQVIENRMLSLSIAAPLVVLFLMGCNRLVRSEMYKLLDNNSETKRYKQASAQATKNPYVFLLSTLIRRNKRLRTTSYSFIFLWLMCILYIFKSPIEESSFFTAFWLIIFFSPGVILGQFMNSWESSFFDALMTNSFDWAKYYKTQYITFLAGSVLLFTLVLPFIYYYQPEKIGLAISSVLFSSGIIYPMIFYTSVFNQKKIDLQRSSFGNMQGSGVAQFFSIMAVFYLTPLIYVIIIKLMPEPLAILTYGALGLIGLLTHPYWLQHVTRLNLNKKYIRLENYKD